MLGLVPVSVLYVRCHSEICIDWCGNLLEHPGSSIISLGTSIRYIETKVKARDTFLSLTMDEKYISESYPVQKLLHWNHIFC